MSTFNDFLAVVNGLPSGTVFSVTCDWCVAQGLQLTPGMAISWGRSFAQCYSSYNTTCVSTGTDNHRNYKKL